MTPNILAFGKAVPKNSYTQDVVCQELLARLDLDELLAVKMEKIFRRSEIKSRHMVASWYEEPFASKLVPSTAERNELYKREAPPLAEAAVREAVERWGGKPEEITDVIVISCTGMMAPGIEFLLIDKLGLRRDINRLGINFMGCFGGFKGLSTAKALAEQGPDRRVLVVCVELCSLHFQTDPTLETFVGNALFADGAAAAIIGQEKGLFSIEKGASIALENSLEEMTWESSDRGYLMRLSERIPLYIRENIRDFLPKLLGDVPQESCDWAFHPGGKAILHTLCQAFGLKREAASASYEVMAKYGNLSSASILFVLDQLERKNEYTVGIGFGPGLSVEGILLK